MTPDGKRTLAQQKLLDMEAAANENAAAAQQQMNTNKANEEDFFDLLSKSQSKRMDDQRCPLKVIGRSATTDATSSLPRKPLSLQNSFPTSMAAPVPKENR